MANIDGLLFIFSIIGSLISLALAIWIYRDAEDRGLNGVIWLLIVLVAGCVGVIIYLLVRNDGPSSYRGVSSRPSNYSMHPSNMRRVQPTSKIKRTGNIPQALGITTITQKNVVDYISGIEKRFKNQLTLVNKTTGWIMDQIRLDHPELSWGTVNQAVKTYFSPESVLPPTENFETAIKYCSMCGAETPIEGKFCPICGSNQLE
jgi:ribosomal protein L40E